MSVVMSLTLRHVPSWTFHILTVSSKLPLTCRYQDPQVEARLLEQRLF